ITLRTGPSLQNRIVRNLTAGARVDALKTDEDSGYTRMRVAADGTEGWELTRYLQAQPVTLERLAAAERNLAAAQTRARELEVQVASLTEELNQARTELESTTTAKNVVSRELQEIRSVSANVLAVRDQNEQLRERVAEAEQRIYRLAMENRELTSDGRQSWFLVGAGVLFGGIVLGLIAPNFKRKKRSSW